MKTASLHYSAPSVVGGVEAVIQHWAKASPNQTLRQRIRQNFTWQAIFHLDILPLSKRRQIS